ncbi:MAG: c-type cytochrome biogenesis protein CcsB, partial [Deltaproteobacteria bacterium HGW-Deltaproteobacteria-17]
MTSSMMFNLTTVAYFAAMILFIVYIASRAQAVALIATILCWLGFGANTAAIALRWSESAAMGYGHAPLSNLYESIVFFAWSILLVYLIFDLKYKQRAIGAFIIPIAFLGMIWAQLGLSDSIEPLVPALQSNWLTSHVLTCFMGYAAFTVAFALGIMFFVK